MFPFVLPAQHGRLIRRSAVHHAGVAELCQLLGEQVKADNLVQVARVVTRQHDEVIDEGPNKSAWLPASCGAHEPCWLPVASMASRCAEPSCWPAPEHPRKSLLTNPPQYDNISSNLQVPVQRYFLTVHPIIVNPNGTISTLILVGLLPLQELLTVGRSTV